MLKPWRFAVLEDLRQKIGLTQKELAGAAHHDPNWYHQVQKWIIEPSWTDVLAMAARVGMNLDSLRQQICKALPVTQQEVQRDADRIRPRKTRGGKAVVRRAAEKEGHYRPGSKK